MTLRRSILADLRARQKSWPSPNPALDGELDHISSAKFSAVLDIPFMKCAPERLGELPPTLRDDIGWLYVEGSVLAHHLKAITENQIAQPDSSDLEHRLGTWRNVLEQTIRRLEQLP